MRNCWPFMLLLIFVMTAVLLPFPVHAEDSKVVIYFFWGDGCPHCMHEKPFLEGLQTKYPEIQIRMFETWRNPENAKIFSEVAKAYGINAQGVPTTFIGDKYWIGYADYMAEEIENKVKYCIENGCKSPYEKKGELPEGLCIHAFLHGECPQCESIEPYLDSMTEKYGIDLKKYDVTNPEEKELYEKFKEMYGMISGSYPIVFMGDRYLVGVSSIQDNLEREIQYCIEGDCMCPAEKIFGKTPYNPQPGDITPEGDNIINIPGIGEIDISEMSLPLFTIMIAGLDSFNPCVFFVLFCLLGMLVYAKSRKRMILIGITFVFFSGFMYFIFMSAWLNLFLILGELMIVTIIAGIFALVIGAINIKDFFFFKKGISLTISDSAKPKLFQRMRNLLKAESLPSLFIGTIILSVASNTYELLCTAGFPMVFTRVLTLNSLATLEYYMYLVLYNVVYVIPLLAIVAVFVITLGSKKMSEDSGQVLKLISGFMMLSIGLTMIIRPDLLSNIIAASSILLFSLFISGLIAFLKKKTTNHKKEKTEDTRKEKNKENIGGDGVDRK